MDNNWYPGVSHTEQPHYQPGAYCKYWHYFGTYSNWNIRNFTNKATSIEEFYYINKAVLDSTSEKMTSLVKTGKYYAINNRSNNNGILFCQIYFKSSGITGKKTQTGIYLKKEKIQSHMHI